MSDETGLSLRIAPASTDVDQVEVEELALQLRQDLLASGIPGVERLAAGPAPEGTRSVELIAAGIGYLITALSAAVSVTQLADFVQRWLAAHPRRRQITVDVVATPGPASTP